MLKITGSDFIHIQRKVRNYNCKNVLLIVRCKNT